MAIVLFEIIFLGYLGVHRSSSLFENVRSLFLKSEKSAIWKSHFFAHFPQSLFLNSDCAIALFVALFKRAIVRAIAQLLFFKERLGEQWHNHSPVTCQHRQCYSLPCHMSA